MNISGVSQSQSPYKMNDVAATQPADIAIEQKGISQINGHDQGARNGEDGQSMLKTADSALSDMYENLVRIRELGIKAASSALYTDEDRKTMQLEVGQLMQSISGISKDTQFNTQKLLDSSMADIELALEPHGGGMDIKMEDVTLENLGIKDFDVTGEFDLQTIDDAIKKVSDARSSLGAQSGALSHSIAIAEESGLQETESLSSIEDLDVEGVVSDQKKQEIMDNYQYFGIQEKAQSQARMTEKLLG